jgi:hypothetical protein
MLVRLFLPPAAVAMMAVSIPAAAADTTPSKAYDPNEKVCETITMIGSRLAKKKFCATRAEWEQMRLRDRQEVERAQTSPCVIQGTSAKGRPSC